MGKKLVAARDLPAGHVLARGRPRREVAGRRRPPAVRARRPARAAARAAARRRAGRRRGRRRARRSSPSPLAKRDVAAPRSASSSSTSTASSPTTACGRTTAARRASRASAATRLGLQAARRGRRRLLHPHLGDERRRSGAGAEDPHRVRPRESRTSCRFCARSSSGAASRSSETAYVGNDVNDAECLAAVGLPVVPADAWAEVVPLAGSC